MLENEYIKLTTDTDKDFVKTGRISGLISGPVDHFKRARKTKIAEWRTRLNTVVKKYFIGGWGVGVYILYY